MEGKLLGIRDIEEVEEQKRETDNTAFNAACKLKFVSELLGELAIDNEAREIILTTGGMIGLKTILEEVRETLLDNDSKINFCHKDLPSLVPPREE